LSLVAAPRSHFASPCHSGETAHFDLAMAPSYLSLPSAPSRHLARSSRSHPLSPS
jgi:hypothetical protein